MYPPMKLDGEEELYLRPMNCPHHHHLYLARARSYREMPLRLAEYGKIFRYEAHGALSGLMRTRGFCQNDAHMYCTYDQAQSEFANSCVCTPRITTSWASPTTTCGCLCRTGLGIGAAPTGHCRARLRGTLRPRHPHRAARARRDRPEPAALSPELFPALYRIPEASTP